VRESDRVEDEKQSVNLTARETRFQTTNGECLFANIQGLGEVCTETILEGFSDVRRNIGERQCAKMKEGKERRAGRQEIRWLGGKSERSPETEPVGVSAFPKQAICNKRLSRSQ